MDDLTDARGRTFNGMRQIAIKWFALRKPRGAFGLLQQPARGLHKAIVAVGFHAQRRGALIETVQVWDLFPQIPNGFFVPFFSTGFASSFCAGYARRNSLDLWTGAFSQAS